jgi:O-antigen/teichoic acid export membrane protein
MPPTENSSARIFDNISALAIAQAVTMVTGFVSTAWVARALGPEGYGVIGFGMAFVSYFVLLVILGTDYYGTREIAQNLDKAGKISARIIGLRAVLGVVSLTAYFVTIYFIDRPDPIKTVMAIQAIGPVFTVIAVDFIFEGKQRMRAVALRTAGASMLSVAGILLFVRGEDDLYIAAAIPMLATAVGTLWLAVLAHRQIVPIRIDIDRKAIPKMLGVCLPMAVSAMLGTLFLNIDIVMVGFLRSEVETGIYTGMSRLYIIVIGLGWLVTAAFRPALAAAFSKREEMSTQYAANMTAVVLFGFPIIAGVIVFPGEVIALIFGPHFAAGVDTLIILQAAVVLGYLGTAASAAMLAWHDQVAHMWCHAVAAVVNIALNAFMIPRYGIEGAAWATLISQIAMLVCYGFRLRLKFSIGVWRPVLILLPCAAAAFWIARQFADWVQDWPSIVVLFVGLTVGTVIYIGLAFICRIISPSDISKLISQRIRLRSGGS